MSRSLQSISGLSTHHARHGVRVISAIGLAFLAAVAHAQDPSMGMTSSVDLLSPMSQEASGTSWLPASTPMYGRMTMSPNGDMLMLHGSIAPRYTDAGSSRGADKFDAPNWLMGMYSHPLDANQQIGARLMLSLDPLTEGGYGYPLLFQTGETWHGSPLHDRQHPHDLVSELSATYSRTLAAHTSGYLYIGYPGEPAIGPPAFMHRLIDYDLPDAPIGHHWQDATHITWGVATAGVNFGNQIKAEGSVFNGREPDENRYAPDTLHLDSYSGRLFYNPNAEHSFQVSYGYQKNAEGDLVNQHRTTASWSFDRPLGDDANFTSTVVWGQNDLENAQSRSNSYLAEADYQSGRHSLFTRLENVQKSGQELVLPDINDANNLYAVGAYTLGYMYDLRHGGGIDTGIGAAFTVNYVPANLTPFYGSDRLPVGFQILFRLRPSRMRMGSGKSKMKAMPSMSMGDSSASAATFTVKATTVSDPPKALQDTDITLLIAGADGKPLTGAKVSAKVEMTSMDMGTYNPAFADIGGGNYYGSFSFSMPGPWRLTVTVTPPGAEDAAKKVFTFDYAVTR